MSFVATRSGLTRTLVFYESPRIKKLAKLFIERHDRAVDEAWYARTVDWNMRFNDEATIISAPYNAYIRLLAKLRQRITQRHPAVNDTRSNCDPTLVEDSRAEEENQEAASSSEQSATTLVSTEAGGAGKEASEANQMGTTIESTSGVIKIMNANLQQSQMADDESSISGGNRELTGGASDQFGSTMMMQQDEAAQAPVEDGAASSNNSDTTATGPQQLNSEQQDQQVAAGGEQTLINVVPASGVACAPRALLFLVASGGAG